MATKGITVAPAVVVETLPPQVTNKSKNVDGDIVTTVKTGSTTEVVKAYVDPDAVFNEIAITTMDMLTDLAKQKFADIIVAGHNTDAAMAGFRTTIIRDMVKQAHKQLVTRVADKTEKKAREFYKELRVRGISVHDAVKMSGYVPEEYVAPTE